MRRRTLALAFALVPVLALALTACGDDTANDADAPDEVTCATVGDADLAEWLDEDVEVGDGEPFVGWTTCASTGEAADLEALWQTQPAGGTLADLADAQGLSGLEQVDATLADGTEAVVATGDYGGQERVRVLAVVGDTWVVSEVRAVFLADGTFDVERATSAATSIAEAHA
ncbi:MAG TPA: hypothetical protein VGE77_03975 [Nocardioides sp.]